MPESPISSEVMEPSQMLRTLKGLRDGYAALAGPCRTMEAINRESEDPADRRRAEHQRKQAEDAERAVTALGQAIKVMEVLTSPKFLGLANESDTTYSTLIAIPTGRGWTTVTNCGVVHALLEAHGCLYPSLASAEGKED